MGKARQLGKVARFLLVAACLFTPPPRHASAQMRHHNDSDFKTLEGTVDRQEEHLKFDDIEIAHNKERLDKMEGIGETITFFFGSGVLFGLATLFQRKRDSA